MKDPNRLVVLLVLVAVFAFPAHGDDRRNPPTIGQLYFVDAATAHSYEQALRGGLHALGYVEGENLRIVSRYANGDVARLPKLLNELIQLRVDILFVSTNAVWLAKQTATTIPIICPSMGDPVEEGLVQSMARPGVNITGLAGARIETDQKRLELAKEVVPKLRRVAVLADPIDQSWPGYIAEYRRFAHKMGVEPVVFEVRTLEEIQAALKEVQRARVQALVVFASPLTILHRDLIMTSAARRLPVVSEGRDLAEAGALLAYSVDFHDQWRRSAVYIDKILKGAKASELPIERPSKFDLFVNMRTARALGTALPESILLRATEVLR